MKKLLLILCLFANTWAFGQEKQVNVKLNPALLSVAGDNDGSSSDNQVALTGLQFGAGLILPFQCDFIPSFGIIIL